MTNYNETLENYNSTNTIANKLFFSAAPIPSKFLHCEVFSVARTQSKEIVTKEYFPSSGGKLIYNGVQMTQDDLKVFAIMLNLTGCSTSVQHTIKDVRKIVFETLNWARRPEYVNKFIDCVNRLYDARLTYENQYSIYKTSFITEYAYDSEKDIITFRYSSLLSEGFITSFSSITQLNVKYLVKFKGLTSWLYSFIESNNCMGFFNIMHIKTWCGSTCKDLRDWKKELKESLSKLQECGLIKSYKISDSLLLRIYK